MPIHELVCRGYRSIRNIRLKLNRVNVLVGPNGCGKTNLYRSVLLLARSADGRLAQTLAEEGGMPSAVWAGKRKQNERVRMELAVTLDAFSYSLSCGLPIPKKSAFLLDPVVKEEKVSLAGRGRPAVVLMERKSNSMRVRDPDGRWTDYPMVLTLFESALAQLREPHLYPELTALREEMLQWRFYHEFRTDRDAPIRQPQIGTQTPVLSHDGRDLAAALQTIIEIGDDLALEDAFARAFPGARLNIRVESPSSRFLVEMQMPGIQRPFEARELSDGTLKYLCLLAAFLSPVPPPLIAINEPENSLHPDLLEPLAELIARAGERSQIWITTHSEKLARAIENSSGEPAIRLEMVDGATRACLDRG